MYRKAIRDREDAIRFANRKALEGFKVELIASWSHYHISWEIAETSSLKLFI